MTQAEIQTQFDDGPCVGTLAAGQLDWLKVILLWQILNGASTPMTQDDIQNLMDEGTCLGTLTKGQLDVVQAELLWEIFQNGGGGGGGGQIVMYTGTDPTSDGLTPTNLNEPATAYPAQGAGGTAIFYWDPTAHVWY